MIMIEEQTMNFEDFEKSVNGSADEAQAQGKNKDYEAEGIMQNYREAAQFFKKGQKQAIL